MSVDLEAVRRRIAVLDPYSPCGKAWKQTLSALCDEVESLMQQLAIAAKHIVRLEDERDRWTNGQV